MTHHTWTPEEAQAAITEITTRAARDADFRSLCLTDPAEALRVATGRALPEGFVLRFVENADADLTVVLPDLVAEGEMADADLEAVAGGLREFGSSELWQQRAAEHAERERRRDERRQRSLGN